MKKFILIFFISTPAIGVATCEPSLGLVHNWSRSEKDMFADTLRMFRRNGVTNGKDFRNQAQMIDGVLTLRIKRFFFEKILGGEKSFEYRVRSKTNDALLESAIRRQAKFLRLHFQDNDIQLLAQIESIDIVRGEEALEPWDIEQGLEPSTLPHWRIRLRNPKLIWKNAKSIDVATTLKLENPF